MKLYPATVRAYGAGVFQHLDPHRYLQLLRVNSTDAYSVQINFQGCSGVEQSALLSVGQRWRVPDSILEKYPNGYDIEIIEWSGLTSLTPLGQTATIAGWDCCDDGPLIQLDGQEGLIAYGQSTAHSCPPKIPDGETWLWGHKTIQDLDNIPCGGFLSGILELPVYVNAATGGILVSIVQIMEGGSIYPCLPLAMIPYQDAGVGIQNHPIIFDIMPSKKSYLKTYAWSINSDTESLSGLRISLSRRPMAQDSRHCTNSSSVYLSGSQAIVARYICPISIRESSSAKHTQVLGHNYSAPGAGNVRLQHLAFWATGLLCGRPLHNYWATSNLDIAEGVNGVGDDEMGYRPHLGVICGNAAVNVEIAAYDACLRLS